MKRKVIWGIDAIVVCLCILGGYYFQSRLADYTYLRKDISRQEKEISSLQVAEASEVISIQSASETVNGFSSLISGFELAEQSLVSEKTDLQSGEWEEWRVEAVCIGSLDSILAFIDTLEADRYYDLNFTININSEGQYELNIKLRFYAYHD